MDQNMKLEKVIITDYVAGRLDHGMATRVRMLGHCDPEVADQIREARRLQKRVYQKWSHGTGAGDSACTV